MDLKGVHFPMQGPDGKFIGKKTFLDLSKKEQEKLLKNARPVKQVRGPGGKFVSKKTRSTEASQDKEGKTKLETVEVNGQKVRKFDYEGSTYLCLEDILAASDVKSPKSYLRKLAKSNSEAAQLTKGLAEAEVEKRKGKKEKLSFATKTQIIVLQSVMGDKLSPEVLDFLHA